MAGQSRREAEAQRQLEELRGFASGVKSGQYNVLNRFENYADPFGYSDITNKLDEIFGEKESRIRRDISEDIAEGKSGATASLASRGITGGSLLQDTLSEIANRGNRAKYNVLGNLAASRAGEEADLMKYFNQNKMNQTQLATNIDLVNRRNMLSGMTTGYGLQQNLLGELDSGTWLDDLFAGVDTASKIAEIASILSTL